VCIQDVPHRDDSQDDVDAVPEYREPRMATLPEDLNDLLRGFLDVDGHDIRAGGHQGADPQVTHADHPLDHILFCLIDETRLGTLFQENLDLFIDDAGPPPSGGFP
jgi:hypothetical protein